MFDERQYHENFLKTGNFRGNLFSHVLTNAIRKLVKINCFKYESSCKGKKTGVLVVKSVLYLPPLNPFSEK